MTEAIADLKRRGYAIDFNRRTDGMDRNVPGVNLDPEIFTITQVYRFDGATDPDDEAVLYVIESDAGDKGMLVNGYGISSDPSIDELVKKLSIHVHGVR